METCRGITGLIDFIAEHHYEKAVEIGIGHFPDVAAALQRRRVSVFATDIRQFRHRGINIVMDDVTMPDVSLYNDRDLIYSMRPPPELIPYMIKLAETISADLIVKPLSTDSIDGGWLIHYGDNTFFLWNFVACLHPVHGSR